MCVLHPLCDNWCCDPAGGLLRTATTRAGRPYIRTTTPTRRCNSTAETWRTRAVVCSTFQQWRQTRPLPCSTAQSHRERPNTSSRLCCRAGTSSVLSEAPLRYRRNFRARRRLGGCGKCAAVLCPSLISLTCVATGPHCGSWETSRGPPT